MPHQWFVDESYKKHFVMIATEIPEIAIHRTRLALCGLLRPHQTHLHMKKESPAGQKRILDELGGLHLRHFGSEISLGNSTLSHARQLALRNVITASAANLPTRITLDNSTHKKRDELTIASVLGRNHDVSIRHWPTRNEPLLWIPDAIAWSLTRGGQYSPANFGIEIIPTVRVS